MAFIKPSRIQCITRTSRMLPYERISHVGGFGWRITQAEAIRRIEAGLEQFEAMVDGEVLAVEVVSRGGHRYLKTVKDTEQPNGLLRLSECG